MKYKILLTIILVSFLFCNSTAFAKYIYEVVEEKLDKQISPQPMDVSPSDIKKDASDKVVNYIPTSAEDKIVSLKFKNIQIEEVLNILAKEGINIVVLTHFFDTSKGQVATTSTTQQLGASQPQQPSPQIFNPSLSQLQQKQTPLSDIYVNIYLENVTIKKAIELICKAADIDCVKTDDNKYQIQRYKTITIDYGLLFDKYNINVSPGLAGQLSGGVSVIGSSGSGSGSISSLSQGSLGDFSLSEDFKSDFIDKIKNLLTSEGKIFFSKRGFFTVTDRPSAVNRVQTYFNVEKEKLKPIKLSVKLLEVSTKDDKSFGINWNAVFTKLSKSNLQVTVPSKVGTTATEGLNIAYSIFKGGDKFEAFIKLLQEFATTKILRDWSVSSKIGLPVVLSDIESVPYLVENTVVVGGQTSQTSTTTNANFVDVGIKIVIIANKLENNILEGNLYVSLSSLLALRNLRTESNPFYAPNVKSSNIVIPFTVKAGDSLMISGLKMNTSVKGSEGVPILSKIPIIGGVFGYQEEKKDNTEFVIWLDSIN